MSRAAVLIGALVLAGCQSLSEPSVGPPRPGSGIGASEGSGSGEEWGTGSGATPEIRRGPPPGRSPSRPPRRRNGNFKCVLRAIGKIGGKAEFVETCDRFP